MAEPTVLGAGLAGLRADTGHEMATTAFPALLARVGVGPGTPGLNGVVVGHA